MAAVDVFLELHGIPGDSVDEDHRGTIEVVAFSWSEHNTTIAGGGRGGGGGAGRVSFGELQVVARTSSASPALLVACASGKRIPTATLWVRRPSGRESRSDALVIVLRDVVVNGYRVGANESGDDDLPTDQVSLAFATIEMTVNTQDARGAITPTGAGWDVVRNRAVTVQPPQHPAPAPAPAPAPVGAAAPARRRAAKATAEAAPATARRRAAKA